jgi:hypothetical protein
VNFNIFLKKKISEYTPGPQGFDYNMISNTDYQNSTYILGNVTNPGSWYNFDFLLTLTPGLECCTVTGISRSQMFGIYDGNMNFCNIDLLIRGFNPLWLDVTNCWWQPSDNSTCTQT